MPFSRMNFRASCSACASFSFTSRLRRLPEASFTYALGFITPRSKLDSAILVDTPDPRATLRSANLERRANQYGLFHTFAGGKSEAPAILSFAMKVLGNSRATRALCQARAGSVDRAVRGSGRGWAKAVGAGDKAIEYI